MKLRMRFAVPAILFLAAGAAFPQSEPSGSQNQRWDLGVWAATATGEEHTNSFAEAQIVTAGIFVGRTTRERGSGWRRGRLEYGFDLMPLFAQFTPQRISGGGLDPIILRWNSSLHAGRAAPYIELGGGAARTTANLPSGDTSNFNFIARGGGGIQIFVRQRQALDIGCRWWHISNANLGRDNPEFNGIQVSIGYHWFK